MLIWGTGGDSQDLGVVETKLCDTCEKDRPFKMFLQYRYAHIWYLFSWITEKKYLLLCDICHRGVELDTKKIEPLLESNPIPFQKRYGWTFLVGLIVLLVAYGIYSSKSQEMDIDTYLNAPQINDLYVVDISTLMKNLERSPLYGVMRIKAISGDQVEFFLPKIGYNKESGASKDIRYGKAKNNDYYEGETLVFSVARLKTMRAKGDVKNINRN